MAIDRIPGPQHIWPVRVPVRDEQMGDILATTDDHFGVVALMRLALLQYARALGRTWLVRADASLVFPRANGKYGSLFPDLLVAFDVDVPGNGPYRTHIVGKPPELLVEILSDETARNDEDAEVGKLGAYAEMGVQEYLTFDPRPRRRLALVGYRLATVGSYQPISSAPEGGLWLETVQLRVVAEPGSHRPRREPRLRFYTPDGQPLPHADEEAARRVQAEQERERAEQERERAEQERERAEQERERAERERDAERAARQDLERRFAALQAQLEQAHGYGVPRTGDTDA
jgi:Uma2 family endonuclease